MPKMEYVEPTDYFPKELRKKFGLGEYAKVEKGTGKSTGKTPKKSAPKTAKKTTTKTTAKK